MANGQDQRSRASIWQGPGIRFWIWPVFALAFSPVLLDLVSHLDANPWTRSALIFPWLAWVAARRAPPSPRRDPASGVIWACLCLGLFVELLAVGGDTLRIARVGMAVAAAGLVWGARWASAASALLLLWAVPVPSALIEMTSPGLESALGRGVSLLSGLGFEAGANSAGWVVDGLRLRLTALDGGLALMLGLAGVGWFRVAASGGDPRAGMRGAVQWAIAGVAVQVVLLLLAAVLLLSSREPGVVRQLLDQAPWLIVTGLGFGVSLPALRQDALSQDGALSC